MKTTVDAALQGARESLMNQFFVVKDLMGDAYIALAGKDLVSPYSSEDVVSGPYRARFQAEKIASRLSV